MTHLHDDHTDPAALAAALAPGAELLRPAPAEGTPVAVAGTAAAEAGLRGHGLHGRCRPSLAGGRPRPVAGDGRPGGRRVRRPAGLLGGGGRGIRILHAGDTMMHGERWAIRERLGPFDAAFLPVNGSVMDFPRQPPSTTPGVLTPEQAASVAAVLGVRVAVPIHYGTIDHPPLYVPGQDAVDRFVSAARARGVRVEVLEHGAPLVLAARREDGARAAVGHSGWPRRRPVAPPVPRPPTVVPIAPSSRPCEGVLL